MGGFTTTWIGGFLWRLYSFSDFAELGIKKFMLFNQLIFKYIKFVLKEMTLREPKNSMQSAYLKLALAYYL